MKYSTSLNFKYLSMKMKWEKWNFYCKKLNFEPIGNSVRTSEYLALGKALLARLYQQLKVYITFTKNLIPYIE